MARRGASDLRRRAQAISGAGHTPQWETPEAFDALIEAFIAETA
jgi:pimeloyl-ACP methyl ester carboxylesterase